MGKSNKRISQENQIEDGLYDLEKVHFFKNEDWYQLSEEGSGYVLTEKGKANPKVVKSYQEFNRIIEEAEKAGVDI